MANVQDEVNSVFQRHAEMHTRTLVQSNKEITTKTATATEAPPPPPKGGAASDWEGYAWLLHHAIESVPPEPEQVVYTGWVGGRGTGRGGQRIDRGVFPRNVLLEQRAAMQD